MSLQIIARIKAAYHLWAMRDAFPMEHDIWRVYRWWGLDTKRVVCVCGQEFTQPLVGAMPLPDLLALIEKRKSEDSAFN